MGRGTWDAKVATVLLVCLHRSEPRGASNLPSRSAVAHSLRGARRGSVTPPSDLAARARLYRVRRGIDIDAGCGQLTTKMKQEDVLGRGL